MSEQEGQQLVALDEAFSKAVTNFAASFCTGDFHRAEQWAAVAVGAGQLRDLLTEERADA